jgi:putative acyl-CoA dehydrogenase
MVGPEGRGIRTIIEMVQGNRFYCCASSAGLMRQGLVQALHHVRHRSAFQKRIIQHPLMRNVIADLAIEAEAALALTLRIGRAMDEAPHDGQAAAFARIGTAVAKYWICKRAPGHVLEALECHGGPGYIEDSIMPRLYREAPVNSIWEGSGNVICLDVLRAMDRDEGTVAAFLARAIVEHMAVVLQASLLVKHSPASVADAFCATRLGSRWLAAYGVLPEGVDLDDIIARALPGD